MWTVQQAADWQKLHPWTAGFNYVPAYAVNSTEMWQKESFDPVSIRRELSAAAEYGYNACRVFLPFLLWQIEHESFMQNLEQFLQIADSLGIQTVPILFDDCAFSHLEPYPGKQNDPVKGIHNSGWTPSPGPTAADDSAFQPQLQAYVQEILSVHSADRRILFWDLYNEPGNNDRGEKSLPLLRSVFAWARQTGPEQPLTAGVWAWESFDLPCLELSDILTYHDYQPLAITKQRTGPLLERRRPLFCTEWLHRACENTFETHLPYFRRNHIGVFQWGLVVGRTQTNLNWDSSLNCLDGQPAVWQHDIFRADLTPYRPEELALLRQLI